MPDADGGFGDSGNIRAFSAKYRTRKNCHRSEYFRKDGDLYDILPADFREFYTRDADMAYIMGMCHIITEYDMLKKRIDNEIPSLMDM